MASIQILIDGKKPKTKAEIKRAIADSVLRDSVSMVDHSMFNNFGTVYVTWASTKPGEYFFAGPDCVNKRNWYGSIVIKSDGKITVK